MEYSESRIYLPGDDVRSIDWRVTARTGRVHTKIFQEERDRPVLFVVDLGEHMRFGTRSAFKSVVAAETASLLAWAAVASGDRVGGLVFAGPHTSESRVVGGRRGALALFRVLAAVGMGTAERDAGDALGDVLPRARRLARPGTLIVVVSDFRGLGDAETHQLVKLREHNDLICVRVHDRFEAVPPPPARYPIGDERRTSILDTRSSDVARAIQHRFEAIGARLMSVCERSGGVPVRIRCGDDVLSILREALGGQRRGSRHRPR